MDKEWKTLFYFSKMSSLFEGVEVSHNFDSLTCGHVKGAGESQYSSTNTQDVQKCNLSFSCFAANLGWFKIPSPLSVSNSELTFCHVHVIVALGVINPRSGVSSLDYLLNRTELDLRGKTGVNNSMDHVIKLLTFKFVRGDTMGLLIFFINYKPLAFSSKPSIF